MKVELDEKGTLIVTAESAIESFALTLWHRMWEEKTAVLLVQTVDRQFDRRYSAVEPPRS